MKKLLEVENLVVHFDTERGLGEAAARRYVARYCLRDYVALTIKRSTAERPLKAFIVWIIAAGANPPGPGAVSLPKYIHEKRCLMPSAVVRGTSAPARLCVPNGEIYLHQFLPILAHIIPPHLLHAGRLKSLSRN
jgi:hypothetical protein